IHLEMNGYRFDHDTLRAFIYSSLPASHRQGLHALALSALRSDLTTPAPTLLYHAEQAADRDAIGVYALQAGIQAWNSGQILLAERYQRQALANLPAHQLRERFRALYDLTHIVDMRANRAEQHEYIDQLLELAKQLDDPLARTMA